MNCPTTEVWRPIPRVVDYEASSKGRIRRITAGRNKPAGRIVSQTNQRYRMVRLYDRSGVITTQVHRLVALAFHGEPSPGMQVAHNDGDRHNNRPENLRWATPASNCADRKQHGTQASMRGERNGACKHADTRVQSVLKARRDTGASFARLAAEFGMSTSQVFRICTGKSRADARI